MHDISVNAGGVRITVHLGDVQVTKRGPPRWKRLWRKRLALKEALDWALRLGGLWGLAEKLCGLLRSPAERTAAAG